MFGLRWREKEELPFRIDILELRKFPGVLFPSALSRRIRRPIKLVPDSPFPVAKDEYLVPDLEFLNPRSYLDNCSSYTGPHNLRSAN